jgi:hypothetical protein
MATQTAGNGHHVATYVGDANFAAEMQRRREVYGIADERRNDMAYLLAEPEGIAMRYTFGAPVQSRSSDYLEECLFRPAAAAMLR